MNLNLIQADYHNTEHATAIISLRSTYALDPMGGGTALKAEVKNNLVKELSKLPHAFSILAFANDKPVGLINCFEAFSTFTCKPLINVHDVMVIEEYREIGRAHV